MFHGLNTYDEDENGNLNPPKAVPHNAIVGFVFAAPLACMLWLIIYLVYMAAR